MEPAIILALGLINMVGNIQSVEAHPNLNDRALTQVTKAENKPYYYYDNHDTVKFVLKDLGNDKIDSTPVVKGNYNSGKYVHEDVIKNNLPPVLNSKDRKYTKTIVGDDASDDFFAVKFILKRDKKYLRKKRDARKPARNVHQEYNDTNDSNKQRHNSYGNKQDRNDFVDDFIDKVENFTDTVLNSKLNGLIAAYNQTSTLNNGKDFFTSFTNSNSSADFRRNQTADSMYPNSTVYSQHSDSVYTYGDTNLQGIVLTNDNINVIKPKRNRTVVHKNSPGVNLTIISDVPANQKEEHNNNANKDNRDDKHDKNNDGKSKNSDQDSRKQGTKPRNGSNKTVTSSGTENKSHNNTSNGYNGNKNNHGHNDFVDDFIDKIENLADSLIDNKKNDSDISFLNGLFKGVYVSGNGTTHNKGEHSDRTPSKNNQTAKHNDSTVYTQYSDSIYTYGDKNVQGVTLVNNNITVTKQNTNRTILVENSPGDISTVTEDVPAQRSHIDDSNDNFDSYRDTTRVTNHKKTSY